MSRTQTAGSKPSSVSRALARDRLGVPAVLFFVLAGVAPLTVAAGVVPTAYQTTGLTGIPAAFLVIAVILALFAIGYVAMTRHITNAGPQILRRPGHRPHRRRFRRPRGTAVLHLLAGRALRRLRAYRGQRGRRPSRRARAVVGVGTGRLGRHHHPGPAAGGHHRRRPSVLLSAEILVIFAETVSGLAHPAGGRLSFATLSPTALTSAGFGTFGVLAVVAVLGSVGFEQAPVLAEEARNARRTIPVATYLALGMIAVVYAGASWAMAVHNGDSHVVAAAAKQGTGLLFGLGGSGGLSQAAQLLFLTSLFAAALAFHNCVWRYMYALGRESVLPAALGRTGGNNIPKAASLVQSLTGLVVIVVYALAGWDPMTHLFFWLGTTGGFGILVLLALTAVAVIAFFGRHPHGENAWRRLIAPALAAILLAGIVVLAVMHYGTLLGVPAGAPAAWALPVSYAVVAAAGLGWGLVLKIRRPQVYAAIGLGAHAVTGQLTPASERT